MKSRRRTTSEAAAAAWAARAAASQRHPQGLTRRSASGLDRVALFVNLSKPEAVRTAEAAARALLKRGIATIKEGSADFSARLKKADLAVSIGGDGTMLKSARAATPLGLPLLGVNSGGFGFLAGVDAADFKRRLGAILSGSFKQEERLMIEISVSRSGRKIFGPHLALNDCVIRCGDQARAILLKMRSQRGKIADYFGDGLIVSTPTGASAYALAAQGPLVAPSLKVLLSLPICPHTLSQRPLVLPSSESLLVTLARRRSNEAPQVLLSLDGQIGCALKVSDEIKITSFPRPLKLLLDPRRSYYETLRRKLGWGER